MITCYITYQIDPRQIAVFEEYARMWLDLVPRFGGTHHGYFLPHESANDLAVALFSFPTLAAYEQYRSDSLKDPECSEAYAFAERTGCIIRYDRHFLRPLVGGQVSNASPDATTP